MDDLDKALERLERSIDALETCLVRGMRAGGPAGNGADPALAAERDRLEAEVERLQAAARRDAELRSEAAEAVKAALADLRALMPEDRAHG